jgi:DNA-binding MarR family transcriptional regulator
VSHSKNSIERGSLLFQVLEYLADHMEAEDTLQGIVEWWLLEQRIKYETAHVKRALQELIAKGLIVEVTGPGRDTSYRINNQKRGEIESLLKQDV